MKKGVFSATIIFITIFLVSATIIYSRLPIQELKTTAKTGGIRNYNFTVQIVRDFADTAFAETIYDEVMQTLGPDPTECRVTISQDEIENRFERYLDPANVDFGACEIAVQEIVIENETDRSGDVSTTVSVSCEAPKGPVPKKIVYSKTHSFKKQFELRVNPDDGCIIEISDYDSGLKDI